MEACSVQQACVYALQLFLRTQFNADVRFMPGVPESHCVIKAEWPGDNLPPRCISILPAGERQDTHLTPEVVRQTNLPNNQGEYTWSVKAITQPLQLDIWAQTDFERGMIEDALDTFFHIGPRVTLGNRNMSIMRDGPLLPLDRLSGHQGLADFTFEGPRPINEGVAAQQSQFRSIIRGSVDAELTFTARTARLAIVKLKGALDLAPYNITLQKDGDAFGATVQL